LAGFAFAYGQGTLIPGSQILGFLAGEWRDVEGTPRRQISAAVLLLISAVTMMACITTV